MPGMLAHAFVPVLLAAWPAAAQGSPMPEMVAVLNNGSDIRDTESEAPVLTFYMYKVIGADDQAPANSSLGSIEAILWYLHTWVASCNRGCETARQDGLLRIARYMVMTKATQSLFSAGMNFGPYHTFKQGQCAGPKDCNEIFEEYGYVIGCQNLSSGSDFHYDGAFYSLPPKCRVAQGNLRGVECKGGQPGGLCQGVPTGSGTCTWTYTEAGVVTIDELEGIANYTAFKELGGEEYSMQFDKGINMTFWDDRGGKKASAVRLERLDALFKEKYPDMPTDKDLPLGPRCDFNEDHPDMISGRSRRRQRWHRRRRRVR